MFDYPCPSCGDKNGIHHEDCRHRSATNVEIERCYIDIISVLSLSPAAPSRIRENAQEGWSELHDSCLNYLLRTDRISRTDDGVYVLTPSDKRKQSLHPTEEPLRTIYEYGTVPGCHDNGVFAIVAWYANQDLSWEETKANVATWLKETGAWDRGGFSENSISELLESKRHVFDESYGWATRGQAAKQVIDNHRQLDPETNSQSHALG